MLELLTTPQSASNQQIRQAALESGFLFFRGLVDSQNVVALRNLVLTACRTVGWLAANSEQPAANRQVNIGDHRSQEFAKLQTLVQASKEFEALAQSPKLIEMVQAAIGSAVSRGAGDVCRISSPFHGVPTVAHQDCFYTRQATTWTVWIPLGACPQSFGGLALLPRSHQEGLLTHQVIVDDQQGVVDLDDRQWASADYQCGDVVMFHGLTVHRALPNTSQQLRLSVDYRYTAIA